MKDLELEATQWHDGQLLSLEVVSGDGGCDVRLVVSIYADHEDAADRHQLAIRFSGVRELSSNLNCREVVDNHLTGNIGFARPNDPKDAAIDLSIYLVGRYIRVLADKYVVEKRQSAGKNETASRRKGGAEGRARGIRR
jgi:hypothetical protein